MFLIGMHRRTAKLRWNLGIQGLRSNFERNMRIGSAFLLMFGVCTLYAQSYQLSNKPQLNQKKSIFHKPLGESTMGIYTLNYANDYLTAGFSVERYGSDFGFIADRFIKTPKRTFVLDLFVSDTAIYWTSVYYSRGRGLQVVLSWMNATLEGEIQTLVIDEIEGLKERDLENLRVSFKKKSSSWLLSFIKSNESNTLIDFRFYDFRGSRIAKKSRVIDFDIQMLQLEQISWTDTQRIFSYLTIQRPRELFVRNQREQSALVVYSEPKFSKLVVKELESDFNLQVGSIVLDPQKRFWCLVGLYGESAKQSEGYYVCKMEIDRIENELNFQLYPFPENTMRILDGRIKLKKVPKPENYLSRRLFVRNDGSLVLILERFIELKQLETYYINGIPQSSTKVLYNFNEIGMLFLNLQHQLDTCLRIDKEQLSGPNTSYMLGFGSYLCEDGIHLVYNQDISKSNEIIDVVVRPDFEIERKVLVNSENFYHTAVPFDGMETNYCTYTLPLLRDKQWFWMRIQDIKK